MVSVTTLLVAEGFIDSQWFTETAREKGTFVHKATELFDKGELDEDQLDPVLKPYLDGWKNFLFDSKFKILEIEQRITREDIQLTGCPDRIGILNGKDTIVDAKSGLIYPTTGLQLSGYSILKDGKRYKRVAVRLGPTMSRGYSITEFKNPTDRLVFLAALRCHNWKQEHNKGA